MPPPHGLLSSFSDSHPRVAFALEARLHIVEVAGSVVDASFTRPLVLYDYI